MSGCKKRPKTLEDEEMEKMKVEEQSRRTRIFGEEFVVQGRRRFDGNMQNNNHDKGKMKEVRTEHTKSNMGPNWNRFGNKKQEYRMKKQENMEYQKEKNEGTSNENRKQWPLQSNDFEAMKKSANKYSVLEDLPKDNHVELKMLKDRMIVGKFLNMKFQPSVQEVKNWSKDMIEYFKNKWEEDRKKESDQNKKQTQKDGEVDKDIIESDSELEENVLANEIEGRGSHMIERKILWKDLYCYKKVSENYAWAILGDMNVTLNVDQHSTGGSWFTEEMQEFRNCINNTEVEDIGSHGIFQPFLISDHSPTILIILIVWQKKAKSFRFANYTVNKPGFIAEVERGWKIQVQGHKMYCLVKRLKSLKPVLNKLNWKNGNLTTRVETLRVKLQEAQTLVERDPHNSVIKSKAIESLNNYNEVVKDEEKLLAQKARIDWLNEGDKNSAFFHKVIKMRRSRNRVDSICDENGVRYVNEEVPMQFEEVDFMVRKISAKEVKDAMFDIGDNRAPGPDGFSSLFFKRAWNVVGKDIITNRIKSALKKLVQINQSAFIPGRVIQDNIMLSQEILRGYGRKNVPKRCAIKIDLQKAYDIISWNFLEAILKNFGFHHKMVSWIMKCVQTAGFSICINDERHGYFKEGRGIRQDDLMIFYHRDPLSDGVIKDAIQEFSFVSGLFPNLNKSTLYFGSIVEAEKEQIKRIMQFNEGSLPTKYLGVPLITKCLGVKDCQNLVDKIKGRTEDWKCKYLSYAGRLMLIVVVLESMNMYWASVFKLPKTVVKEINRILKRDKIASRLQYEVGNGRQIHMWFDRWHSSGLLIEQITYKDLYDARMPKIISIADMIDDGNWKWPSAWRNEGLEIMNINVMKALTANEDKVKWLLTQDKIMAWGIQTGLLCSLCKKVNDSHGHLFFQCVYSKEVWNRMDTMMNMDKIDYQWNEVVSELLKYKHGKNIWSAVRRISFAAMIYYIWQERNQRILRGENRDTDELFKAISEVIKLNLINIRVRNTADVRKVAKLWEIQSVNKM
ncbi:RNA-directed DNA polymerase, eukaryota, reverse transcriptase zinc-binding domain protein [Tanacetum coccineum]